MARLAHLSAGLVLLAVGVSACTKDFDQFSFEGSGAGADASVGGAGGTVSSSGGVAAGGLGSGGAGAATLGGAAGSAVSAGGCGSAELSCDDQCMPIDDEHCGTCSNDCAAKGLVCLDEHLCGCGEAADCGGSSASCGEAIKTCICSAESYCQWGETCEGDQCSCNGGPPCDPGQLCCEEGAGCVNQANDEDNCGSCGHRCAPGERCQGGTCR